MSNQLTRFNRVRYFLYGKACGTVTDFHPVGWTDDDKELLRSDKYDGIMANLSNLNLKFYKKAFFALKSEYDINGIKAEVRIEKEIRNENTDTWENVYTGYLDFKSYKANKNFISIKINESNFFKNIESRFKEPFELERLDDLKNGILNPLEYKKMSLTGREIFRETLFTNVNDDGSKDTYKYIPSDNSSPLDEYWTVVPLKKIKYRSDERIFEVQVPTDTSGWMSIYGRKLAYTGYNPSTIEVASLNPNSGQVFYLNSFGTKTLNIELKLSVNVLNPGFTGKMALVLSKHTYNSDSDLSFDGFQVLGEFMCIEDTLTSHTFNANVNVTIGQHQCLCLSVANPNRSDTYVEWTDIDFKVSENTVPITTDCMVLTYYQVFERLFRIVTGLNCFQSNLLSNEWKDLVFTNGFKIRNINDKNITTSLEEVYNSLNAIEDIAIFIENRTVRIEKKSEAYRNELCIDLGVVSNIEREINEKLHYSTIEIGSDFNGVYEEVAGLDEYNIRTSYTTCLDTLDNKFNAISKVRFDTYGMTLAQEKQVEDFPKLDTKYDKYNFAVDCKLVTIDNELVYVARYYGDDFDTIPTGVYSPETAFNLRLSPFNSLLRKSKSISTGLQKYPTELLKYSSTEGNSNLVTLYPERAKIENSILSKPYFLPETITFDKKITESQFKKIVKNPYNYFKFVNEYGKYEYCFIYPSVKPSKEGKFVTIKANI